MAFNQDYGQKKEQIKGVYTTDGVLYLTDVKTIFGRRVAITASLAHEMAHALDGTDHRITRTPEWTAAWQKEIREKLLFGKNGAKSPREGWAEFAEFLLGGEHPPTRAEVRQELRRCLKVWEAHGL